jgi:hypothetical protein
MPDEDVSLILGINTICWELNLANSLIKFLETVEYDTVVSTFHSSLFCIESLLWKLI